MAYVYQPIWEKIKLNLEAEVTVSEDKVATLIQGVKRTKCTDNAKRASVGLIPFSRLTIEQEKLSDRGVVKVKFKLLYDTRV